MIALVQPVESSDRLAADYAACERLARDHYENFPVASRLLPRRMRPHIAAVYAFARIADDAADEGDLAPAERHRQLDQLSAGLRAIENQLEARDSRLETADIGSMFRALTHTIEACELPISLFDDLLSAFRQDITTHRYETWDDLMDYCRRSANPIGRLVLRIAGYNDESLDRASDAVCTALQLTNFWQDLERDWKNGRLYVPCEEWAPVGAREADLDVPRLTPAWRTALEAAAKRTRALFVAGRFVCDGVHGRLRWELRVTWLGGVTILDRLEARGFDVFRARPSLGVADAPRLLWRALRWQTADGALAGRLA